VCATAEAQNLGEAKEKWCDRPGEKVAVAPVLMAGDEAMREAEPQIAQCLLAEKALELRTDVDASQRIGAVEDAIVSANAGEFGGEGTNASLEAGESQDKWIDPRIRTYGTRHRGLRVGVGGAKNDEQIDVGTFIPGTFADRTPIEAAGVKFLAEFPEERLDGVFGSRGGMHLVKAAVPSPGRQGSAAV
jgi:hypothetical protein